MKLQRSVNSLSFQTVLAFIHTVLNYDTYSRTKVIGMLPLKVLRPQENP